MSGYASLPPAKSPEDSQNSLLKSARAFVNNDAFKYVIGGIFLLFAGILMIIFICMSVIYNSKRNLQIVYIFFGVLFCLFGIFMFFNAYTAFRSLSNLSLKPNITQEVFVNAQGQMIPPVAVPTPNQVAPAPFGPVQSGGGFTYSTYGGNNYWRNGGNNTNNNNNGPVAGGTTSGHGQMQMQMQSGRPMTGGMSYPAVAGGARSSSHPQ